MSDRPSHLRPAEDADACAGFSLVEAVVALAVFSIAAVALLNAEGESARAATALEDRFGAQIVAENLMVEHTVDAKAAPTANTGTQTLMGQTWYWRRAQVPVANSPFTKITIDVAKARDGRTVYSLSSLESAHGS
ncbi:type II secretion system minor pseudopilin GspI [Kordiimonas marina]|uniref:type II secretion system minor pseudopilin GspI n=1 Tax=Kordiimonas marina TaxID=2872312 RepID=UPI001FF33BA2|nr:type II secretion system minor pseudopilin GspI [Kordiimonas marina]MCJ9430050.1 type II secretion system minor pseudopilin GspI [Kordiimonas marina]